MRRMFHVFVRQHHNGWYTAQLLTLPNYAAYGPYLSSLLEEISDVLKQDLSKEHLRLHQSTYFEDVERRSINLTLKAVQHQRLTEVPMRFTLLCYPISDQEMFEVRIPRIDEVFRIQGEENIEPWAEETIRGHFHLDDLRKVLGFQFERSERLEAIEVVYNLPKKAKRIRAPQPGQDPRFEASHPLSSKGIDLVAEAEAGRLPGAQFRAKVLKELMGILSSRTSPSALLVGSSGVGKTSLVNELAIQLAEDRAPPEVAGARVWFISGSRIIAGAKFLGEWQARCQEIVELIQRDRDVLFVGNLMELLSSGSTKTGLNVAQFLLPAMQTGELSVIAEATPDALAQAQRRNPAFIRAFQKLPIPQLDQGHTIEILERTATSLAKEHKIQFTPGTIGAVLDVVARFGDAEALPGSGLQLLDQMSRLAPKDKGEAKVQPKDAISAFSRSSGFPTALIDPGQLLDIERVRDFFQDRVMGQDPAMSLLCDLIMLLKAGLNDPEKPLGSFLFMGPTGVGKTETALTLAEYLFNDRKRLLRLDMSEFGYPGAALRLVEGDDGEGELTKKIREQPFSVVLFDEVEKADGGVFDLLLQVLGEGRLTDGTGKTVRFTHTIVIMTSNLGAKKKADLGFSGEAKPGDDRRYLEAAERFFRPEFVNRIDHLVPFSPLDRPSIRRIAHRMLNSALKREGLARRGVQVQFSDSVIDHLVRSGFDPKYGARPMKRAVESSVTVPLARALMDWTDPLPSRLLLDVIDGQVKLRRDS